MSHVAHVVCGFLLNMHINRSCLFFPTLETKPDRLLKKSSVPCLSLFGWWRHHIPGSIKLDCHAQSLRIQCLYYFSGHLYTSLALQWTMFCFCFHAEWRTIKNQALGGMCRAPTCSLKGSDCWAELVELLLANDSAHSIAYHQAYPSHKLPVQPSCRVTASIRKLFAFFCSILDGVCWCYFTFLLECQSSGLTDGPKCG